MSSTARRSSGNATPMNEAELTELDAALAAVRAEVQKARGQHGPMRSPHEGWAVIYEELDELWDEVKADRGREAGAVKEATQTAATAVRYLLDLCQSIMKERK